MIISNRVANFTLPIEFVESGEAGKLLAHIEFTPIRVECFHYHGYYEFTGISPRFKESEEGSIWPAIHFTAKLHDKTGKLVSVTIKYDDDK